MRVRRVWVVATIIFAHVYETLKAMVVGQISEHVARALASVIMASAAAGLLSGCGIGGKSSVSNQPYRFKLLDNSPSGSPFSRVHLVAEGTLQITTDCSIFNSYPKYAEISVWINSRYFNTFTCSSAEPQVFSISPDSGAVVDVVSGTRIRLTSASPVTGDTIQTVSGTALSAFELAKPLVVVYGDSIACGFGTDIPSRDAWTVLLRSQFEVGVEAWGSRSLASDDAAGFERLVSYFASYGTAKTLWLAIGVNDFLQNTDPVQFKAEYASLLDVAHSAFPTTQIFAQTPLTIVNEGPNAIGYTLSEYRTAIVDVCASRSYCHFIDGTSILTTTDLNTSDGVHPTTEGNEKYEAYVQRVLQGGL